MKACVVVIAIAGGVLDLLFGLFLLLYGGVAGQAGLGARLAGLGNGLGQAGVMFLILGAVAIAIGGFFLDSTERTAVMPY